MAFDTILSKLKTPEKPPSETFFALEVTSETIKSAIWLVENKQTQVLKVGKVEEWREQDKESFLKAVDASISSAGEGIVPEPKGILFGLPEDWVIKDDILPQRKELLRQISQKLDLKPLGFVVTVEALVQHFKAQQGTPLNAVLIRLGETDLLVSLVVVGKVKGSELVGRTEDLVADVREGLARFSVDNLPPRLILYNGLTDFEDAKQQLLSCDWQKELPFLHFPKIESLNSGTSIRAIAVAGGSEVARSLGLEVEAPKEKETGEPEVPAAQPAAKPVPAETEAESRQEVGESEELETLEVEPELKVGPGVTVPEEPPVGEVATALGFVKGKDILTVESEPMRSQPREKFEAETREESAAPESAEAVRPTHRLSELQEMPEKPKAAWLAKLLILPAAAFRAVFGFRRFLGGRLFRLPLRGLGGMTAVVVSVFAILLIGGFAAYWYLPSAEVTIFVAPNRLEKELTFTVDTQVESVQVEKTVIPGKTQEIESQGSLTGEATGTKLVGDAATGKVTIFNKMSATKTFDKGTVLVGPDNLRFELSEKVTVASKSSELVGDGEKISYGKATAGAEASDIGPEYNLSGGTELTFKDFGSSQYSAKADQGFSGGSSREIRAVSQEDQDQVLKKLTDQLKAEAENKLEAQIGGDQNVLPEAMSSKVVNEAFNHKVGEEANELSLDLAVTLTALSFSQKDLDTLLLHQLAGSVPSGFQLTTEAIKTQIDQVTVNDGQAKIKAIAKAELLPQYDLEELRNDLVGKYPPLVEGHFNTLPNFVKADIKITPTLPGKLGTLPRVKDKIKITVEAAE